ncbi:hypothetical protein J3E69DRAFT_366517 [Trichoderma sp. SZMC 28015]
MDMPRWPKQYLLFCLIPLVQAYHVFNTNCSVPSTLSNFVSSPNTRGTLDILWSSLFTILACTWTLQHPNVPEQREGRDPGLLGDIQWGLKGLYRSTLRMVWTVIAPEVIIAAAGKDLLRARRDNEEMRNQVENGKGSWSLTHSYYANMGGFVIRGRVKPRGKPRYHDPYHLTSKGIFALIEGGYIDKLPDMTEEEIKDKSKGDLFVKMIAVGQIAWSVIQIIGRAARRLPVSPLEVAVVAFAVCAVIIHALYWHKPQRVGITTTIHLKETSLTEDGAISEEVLTALNHAQKIKRFFGEFVFDDPSPGSPISLDSEHEELGEEVIIAVMGAMVFGAIHVVAWNFAFPSRVELIFWRCASLFTTAGPLGFFIWMMLLNVFEVTKESKRPSDRLLKLVSGTVYYGVLVLLIFLYIVARLFILVEMFRTLCFLPLGSYVSTWTSSIPHVG